MNDPDYKPVETKFNIIWQNHDREESHRLGDDKDIRGFI